ncbi:MAG: septal ring lytic transglycosylase RlpA family protein [Gammaproteobacteria bacterium]|nr:septal ring lytic transglycosylase RlpA family protein [Gammaproteobacteria bacterium]
MHWLLLFLTLLLSACGSLHPPGGGTLPEGEVKALSVSEIMALPELTPKSEPLSKFGNMSSYTVNGQSYHVLQSSRHFIQEGLASWYGSKFHGRRASSGETFNMYAISAAHKQLPLPTYLRVTNLENGKTTIVRVNDRGPFVGNRIIDLSYASAVRLGFVNQGSARVRIEAIDIENSNTPQTASGKTPPTPAQAMEQALKSGPVVAPMVLNSGVADAMPLPLEPQPLSESTLPQAINENSPGTDETVSPVTMTGNTGDLVLQAGAFSTRENAQKQQQLIKDLGIKPVFISEEIRPEGPLFKVRIGPLTDEGELQRISETLRALDIITRRVNR